MPFTQHAHAHSRAAPARPSRHKGLPRVSCDVALQDPAIRFPAEPLLNRGKQADLPCRTPHRWRGLQASCGRRIGNRIHPPCRRRMNRDGDLMKAASLSEPRASRFAAGHHLCDVRRLRPSSRDRRPGMACRDAPRRLRSGTLPDPAGARDGVCRAGRAIASAPARRTCRNHRTLARRDHGPGEEGPSGGCREAHRMFGGRIAGSERWHPTCAAAGKPRRQSSATRSNFVACMADCSGIQPHRIRPSDSPGIRRPGPRNAVLAGSVGTHTARRRSQPPAARNIPATSTATPSGSDPMPTAARACLPASPNTSIIKSEAPFITCA